jgi:hypothetical protein
VASLAEDATAAVEGIAVPLPADRACLVDHKEGAISGLYVPLQVSVAPLQAGEAISALAFRAAPDRRLPADAPPSRRFLEALIRGAQSWKLSDAYVASLQARLAQAR